MNSRFSIGENHSGYDIIVQLSNKDIMMSVNKKAMDIAAERIAEEIVKIHKEHILSNMSLKSLIKATYKRASKMIEDKILRSLP